MATVVTAFYEIPSKFPKQTYWQWFSNFANVPCKMVIFTSPELADKIKRYRFNHKEKTVIIPIPFSQLYHYSFLENYKREYEKDYNKSHSPELYIIWAEKVKFIMRAIELNPFHTDKFVWCDFGAFRSTPEEREYENFPNAEKIVNNKMNMLLLQDFLFTDLITDKDNLIGQKYGAVRIGGGILGGDKEAWTKYDRLWDFWLKKYFKSGRFAGQDQCIIGSIYLMNQDFFHLIRPVLEKGSKKKFDPWFYLLQYWN